MPFAERIVPADTDVLCESCGYTLNGLPGSGNCPECGSLIVQSTIHDGRSLSEYELNPRPSTFFRTTLRVIFDTKRFYRTLKSREETKEARVFANTHRLIAWWLLGTAATGHWCWMIASGIVSPLSRHFVILAFAIPITLFVLTFAVMLGLTRLATWLTVLEARFWGMRLPRTCVVRAMQFHNANYLPVGLLACIYIWLFYHLRRRGVMPFYADTWYLYGLCGLVILSALYLFKTYWIAMKSLMFANR